MPTIDDQGATLALTRELIARRSVTPDDAGCQDSMMARLEQVGFSVEPMRFGEVDNFWATRGTSGPLLVFAGHTDVVPPGDEVITGRLQPFVFHAVQSKKNGARKRRLYLLL